MSESEAQNSGSSGDSSGSGDSGGGGGSGGSANGGNNSGINYRTQAWGVSVIVVELQLDSAQFKQLPLVLQAGQTIKVIPTFFSQVCELQDAA
jgi:hypothetical protein